MSKKFFFASLIGLFLVIGFLLFYHLGAQRIWQDEAEVAMLARRVRQYGLPVTWDGEFLITQENGQDSKLFNGIWLWNWYTWGQYYPTALSFSLFGETTFAARLPFIIFGLASLALLIWLLRLVGQSLSLVLLSAIAMSTSIHFLLFSRQARYYTLNLFMVLLMVVGYILLSKKRNVLGRWLFLIGGILGFHSTNFVTWAAGLAGIWIHFFIITLLQRSHQLKPSSWLLQKSKRLFFWLSGLSFIIITQALIWMFFFQPAQQQHRLGFWRYWGGWSRILEKTINYLRFIDTFYFPLILVALILIWRFIKQGKKPQFISFWLLITTLTLTHILIIASFLQFGQRYLFNLLPWVAIIEAWLILKIFRWQKIIGFIFAFLLLGTNLFHQLSNRIWQPSWWKQPIQVRSYFLDYTNELIHPPHGPIDGIVEYLEQHSQPGDVVAIGYEENALKFYFPELIIAKRQALINQQFIEPLSLQFSEVIQLDWSIPRREWGGWQFLPTCVATAVQQHFQKIELNTPDLRWQNMPDITYHRFTTDQEAESVEIWHRYIDESIWQKEVSQCYTSKT